MVGRTFSFSARAFNSENAPFVVDVTFLTAPTTITTPATATAGGLLTGGTFRAVRVVDGATATGTWATIIPPTNAALPVAANLFFVVAAAAGGTSTFGAGTGLGLDEGVACTSSTFCSLLITVNAPCNGKTVDIAASMGMSFGPQAVVNAAIPGVTVGGQVVVTSSPVTTVAQIAPPVAVPMVIDANGNVLVSQGRLATGVEAECC